MIKKTITYTDSTPESISIQAKTLNIVIEHNQHSDGIDPLIDITISDSNFSDLYEGFHITIDKTLWESLKDAVDTLFEDQE